MKITADNVRSVLQGSTIITVDQQGQGIPNVVEFDTDTFLCAILGGVRAVAAGFAIVCSSLAILDSRKFLDSMHHQYSVNGYVLSHHIAGRLTFLTTRDLNFGVWFRDDE